MLDTNIVSSILRNRTGEAACRFRETMPGSAGTSILVGAELRFGYLKTGSARLRDLVENFLADVDVADWVEPCGIIYAELRTDLVRRGALIGPMDMLIAAHALALDAVLVTDNEREFGRVAGLKVENWIR
ncbi:type II toxin-antitoxin system VapC family toxin [Chthonobacter rhizosphaerae]|uniref:type II toxin-antitoxin system VapC family toxin n=1 Tax=Chthonobacter rhizosphaerae TaxID=2735553 RepID=UPI0015EFA6E2|nr:type II toxin-antitoxin system VapC family toxin [Chthonobacter rhizosphaerae]